MKAKNVFLTGALMVGAIIGVSAHDKGAKDNLGVIPVPNTLEVLDSEAMVASLHSGLMSLNAASASQEQARLQAYANLLFIKHADVLMTGADLEGEGMETLFATSPEQLAAQQRQQELLSDEIKSDRQITESEH